MEGDLAPCLSLHFLGLSQDASFMFFASQALAFPFLLLAGSTGLCWALLRILQAKHPQSFLLDALGSI